MKKRYNSVQPIRQSFNQQNADDYLSNKSNSQSQIKMDEMDVIITKIKREEIKIKEPWKNLPNKIINCGKHHDENPEYSQASASKWLENRIKKKNQDRVLLKAMFLQRENDEEYQGWKEKELGRDLIDQVRQNIASGYQKNQNSSSPNLKLEKVLWKKRMINELHDINRFMDEFNGHNREERANQERQRVIGDLAFNDGDQKRLKYHKEQRYRMNQLHKRLYGHESLERVQAKGFVKELLVDFISQQIKQGIKEKDEITETITNTNNYNTNNNGIKKLVNEKVDLREKKQVQTTRNTEQLSPIQRKVKSQSLYGNYHYNNQWSPEKQQKNQSDKKIQNNKKQIVNQLIDKDTTTQPQNKVEKETDKKINYKTRSDIQFERIDKINKDINDRLTKDYNQLHAYTFAESEAIRDEQSNQIILINKQRQSQIESEFCNSYQKRKQIEEQNDQFKQSINLKRVSDNASIPFSNTSQNDLFKNCQLNKSDLQPQEVQLQSQNKLSENDYQTITKSQRESLQLFGDSELGKEYFRYLKKNNEKDHKKQEEWLKEKLKSNPSLQKILVLKKIENISQIQNFYEDYINHIQRKVLKTNNVEKIYVPKPDYRSLTILPNMQRKAEMEEEEKLRKLREEEEKKNTKKIRVFRQIQSQNDLDENPTQSIQTKNNSLNKGVDILLQNGQFTPKQYVNNSNKDQEFSKIFEKVVQNDNQDYTSRSQNNRSIQNFEKSTIKIKRDTTPNNISKSPISQNINERSPQIQNKTFFNYSNQNSQIKIIKDSILNQNSERFSLNAKEKKNNLMQEQTDKSKNQTKDDTQEVNQLFQNLSSLLLVKSNSNHLEQKRSLSQKSNRFQLNIKQQENPPQTQETQSPLLKRLNDNFQFGQQNEQNFYYTPQKIKDIIQSQQRDCQTSIGNRETTLDSPEIKNKLKYSYPNTLVHSYRKSDSVGRLRSSQTFRNVSIPNLQGFDKVNLKDQKNTSSKLNSNFIEKIMDLNKQCQQESQNVNRITKNILLRQRKNVKTFTKLDDMINNII